MALLSVRNLTLSFGGPTLFENATFEVDAGERVCLIGRNGVGKSSLLRIVAGKLEPDAGESVIARGSHAAFLAQEVPERLAGTVREIVIGGLGEIGKKILACEAHDTAKFAEAELDAMLLSLEENSAWNLAAEADAVITKLGLVPALEFASLSAGMKRRVLLARELVSKPDILVLDEPTNHLDIAAIEQLEEFLLGWRGAVLFVTHDRRFLKKISTRILDLEGGIVTSWDCDYETYLARREELDASIAANRAEFDKKLAREEAWLRQGVKARRCRNEGRVRELQKLRAERAARRADVGNVRAAIYEGEKSGAKVIVAEHISHTWNGVPVIRDFSTTVMRGDRIGIVGPNGIGKTTLLKILLGKLAPDTGTVTLGTNLQIAYFDQLREQLKEDKTLIENLAGEGADTVVVGTQARHVIGYLGDFLFSPDRARSKVSMLSGGERNRLLLAKIFMKPANLLVLDEPTNDLDLETLDLLEELLAKFDGTVVLVTHDREFLDDVTTSTIVFEGNGELREFVGDYDSWRKALFHAEASASGSGAAGTKNSSGTKKNSTAEKTAGTAASAAKKPSASRKKLSYKEKRELEALPQKIDALEAEQKTLSEKLNTPEIYRDAAAAKATNARLAEIEDELMAALERWEELEQKS